MRLVLIVLVVLMGVVAMFAIQNPGIITVKFFTLSGETSILVVIVTAFGAGGAPASGSARRLETLLFGLTRQPVGVLQEVLAADDDVEVHVLL